MWERCAALRLRPIHLLTLLRSPLSIVNLTPEAHEQAEAEADELGLYDIDQELIRSIMEPEECEAYVAMFVSKKKSPEIRQALQALLAAARSKYVGEVLKDLAAEKMPALAPRTKPADDVRARWLERALPPPSLRLLEDDAAHRRNAGNGLPQGQGGYRRP